MLEVLATIVDQSPGRSCAGAFRVCVRQRIIAGDLVLTCNHGCLIYALQLPRLQRWYASCFSILKNLEIEAARLYLPQGDGARGPQS
jgi:hypothetical protein